MRYLLTFIFLPLLSCYQPTRNCNDYKTGTFRFNYVLNGISKTGTFKRTKTHSVSFYDKHIDSSEVKWINNCEFILHKIKPKSISEKDPIHIKILTTTDSSYTFEYSKASFNAGEQRRKEKGIAFKIN